MEVSDHVAIVVIVPQSHADKVREAMGQAGAGRIGNYSHCSFSIKGTGRFKPIEGADPYLGKEGVLQEVIEERIETVCHREILDHVLEEIKKVHPYEEAIIDIYSVCLGLDRKNQRRNNPYE